MNWEDIRARKTQRKGIILQIHLHLQKWNEQLYHTLWSFGLIKHNVTYKTWSLITLTCFIKLLGKDDYWILIYICLYCWHTGLYICIHSCVTINVLKMLWNLSLLFTSLISISIFIQLALYFVIFSSFLPKQ